MAATSRTTRAKNMSYRRQALIWLVMTLLLGVITALIWMFSQTPAIGSKIENAPIATPQPLSTELEQPLSVEALHELDNDVQPINFEDTIRDLRNYPDEFKDKRYLLANKGKWTVQVMNVAENQVIASYLDGREDREKFSYFRYRDENNQLRYMLTYGIMSSPQEAVGAAKLVDFGLPANVRVLPEEISRYVGIIDNYERPEPIKDLSTRRSRSVRLKPTQREVPVRQPEAPTEYNDNFSNGSQSIRQSTNTADTLALNEERMVAGENGNTASTTNPNDRSANTGQAGRTLPVVPTPPKPPSLANNTENTNRSTSNSANGNTTSNNSNSATNNNSANNRTSQNNSNQNNTSQNSGSRNNTGQNSTSQNSTSAPSRNPNADAANDNNDSIRELIEETTP